MHFKKSPSPQNDIKSSGILLVDKPKGKTSFSLISALRKILQVQKIGHAGTLDPMATGVMVLLIGKAYTSLSNQFLTQDKEYLAEITLGAATDTFDAEGKVTKESPYIPTLEEVTAALKNFQGQIEQKPPMFSAKKVDGKKLYQLAREGIEVERKSCTVFVKTTLIEYSYPKIILSIACSKGTYVRSIADELGDLLTSGGHLSALSRTRSGPYTLAECVSGKPIFEAPLVEAKEIVLSHLKKTL